MLFTYAPFFDIINGNTNNIDYWVDNNYISFDDNIQKGFIPSVIDENYLTLTQIKIYEDTFNIPKFGLVFFVVNNMVGLNEFVWILYDEEAQEEVIRIKDVPFFTWKFNRVGRFTLKAEVFDTKGNKSINHMVRYINVKNRVDYIDFIESKLTERAQKI